MPGRDIVVVGGGPVGAAAALALARSGFDVVLVERGRRQPPFDSSDYSSRVYALSPASQRLLAGVGVWDAIAGQRVSPCEAMRVWVDDPAHGLHFAAGEVAAAELGWIVEHPLLVDALWAGLETAGVPLSVEVGDAKWVSDQDGGRIVTANGESFEARLVIAADGADSQLRATAGIQTVGWSYAQRAIVCNLCTERSHRHTAWQRFLASGPLALLPLADGRSSVVWSADETRARELLGLDDAAFCGQLTDVMPVLGTIHTPTARMDFPLRLLHAATYARSGLVLVGDAAHTVHPLAGQGVNLGLVDVTALCDTLCAARNAGRDWSSLHTLRRYERARRVDNLQMLALTDSLMRAFRVPLPGVRRLLGAAMRGVDAFGPLKNWLAAQAAG